MGLTDTAEVKEHCSDFQTFSACNCGKSRAFRPDPFTLRAANYDFFEFKGCCDKLEEIELKINEEFPSWKILILGNAAEYDQNVGLQQDGFIGRSKFLFPYELEPPAAIPVEKAPRRSFGTNEEEFPPLQPGKVDSRKVARASSSDHQAEPRTAESQSASSIGDRKGRRDRRRDQTITHPSLHRQRGGWFGYEYECPFGNRLIFSLFTLYKTDDKKTIQVLFPSLFSFSPWF